MNKNLTEKIYNDMNNIVCNNNKNTSIHIIKKICDNFIKNFAE